MHYSQFVLNVVIVFQLIPPDADLEKKPKLINIPAADVTSLQRDIIKELDNLHRGNRTWPRFTPVKYVFVNISLKQSSLSILHSRILLEEVYLQVPRSIKLILMVVERHDDITGRQVAIWRVFCRMLVFFIDRSCWISSSITIK